MAAGPPLATPVAARHAPLNYTSGTTGRPKASSITTAAPISKLAMVVHARLDTESRYLWTLPMFHCNGWCFTWAVTAAGATRHSSIDRP